MAELNSVPACLANDSDMRGFCIVERSFLEGKSGGSKRGTSQKGNFLERGIGQTLIWTTERTF